MFGDNTPLNHCQACYLTFIQAKGQDQSVNDWELYAAACKAGFQKLSTESMAEYSLRCQRAIGSVARLAKSVVGRDKNRVAGTGETTGRIETNAGATQYLEAHADHAERVKA